MTKELLTPRLTIRPFSPGDGAALTALLTDEAIKQTYMIPDLPDAAALKQMRRRYEELSLMNDRFVRGVYRDGTLIGFVNDTGIEGGTIELGFALRPDCWGKGYATEMLRAVIAHLLDNGFSRVKTGAFAENKASLRVMEKCGMHRLSQTEPVEYRGRTHTCIYYEQTAARPPQKEDGQ